jgi:hypothetical protein
MKYAFIALIAIYLVVYGCSPDSSEKATDSHDKTAPVTLEKPHEAEMVAAPADLHESAAPAHDEHQFPAKNLETPVVVEEQQEAPVVEQRVIVETQPASKEEQPAEVADSEMVVMPCGKTMAQADIPENAPCLKQQQQPEQETAATEPDLEAAILKLTEKTNEMIQATNQLIDATNKAISTVQAKQK